MPIALEYPVTRYFRWRWFSLLSIIGGTIVFGFLIVLNIPLTGYETITVFQNNFNVTQAHWFDRLMPFRKPEPGSLCDARVFDGGDPFWTNYSFYEWSVDTIKLANAGHSGIRYAGTPLTYCDVTSVYFKGDLYTWQADVTVISTCKEVGLFEFTAKTFFSLSGLPGVQSPIVDRLEPGRDDIRGRFLGHVMHGAAADLVTRAYTALLASDHTTPVGLGVLAQIPFCPMSLGPQAPCSTEVPQVTITEVQIIFSNSTTEGSGQFSDPALKQSLLGGELYLPMLNMFQTIYAAVRVDWGNNSPNNFILNRDATNATLAATFPVTQWISDDLSVSQLAYNWNHPDPLHFGAGAFYPTVTIDGPATIQVVYLCRFQKLKSLGSLVVSVLVATLSMFSSGWAIFMMVAAAVARKKDPTANRCDGHCSRHRMMIAPSWFDTFNPYMYPPEERRTPNDVEYQPLTFIGTTASPSTERRTPNDVKYQPLTFIGTTALPSTESTRRKSRWHTMLPFR